jgi:putative transposase
VKLFATKHSHAELFVHTVWATKDRAAVLDRELRARLSEQAEESAKHHGAVVLAFGGVADHLHVLLRYRPDLAVSDLVRRLKASLTRTIRRDMAPLPDFEWQTGYGAFSVSSRDVDRVFAYVSNQERHHREGTIWPEVEIFE